MTNSEDLCGALCHILGNSCRIGRTAKSYEWNVSGRGAVYAEVCFREQADEMHAALAPLARHIRSLGGRAILDYSDAVVVVNPPTAADVPVPAQMCENLAEGHKQAIHSIGAAIDIAREMDELPTIQLLSLRIEAHRGSLHRLSLITGAL